MWSDYCKIQPFLIYVIIIIFSFLLLSSSNLGSSDTTTITSPMNVESHIIWKNSTIIVESEIRVLEGGHLEIIGSRLSFNGTYDLSIGITIEPGGSIELKKGEEKTILQRGSTNNSYFFRGYQNSKCVIDNTIVVGLGMDVMISSPWKAGCSFRSNDLDIRNSLFVECNVGIGIEGSRNVSIYNCTFLRCIKSIWITEGESLDITKCTFNGCKYGIYAFVMTTPSTTGVSVNLCRFSLVTSAILFSGGRLLVDTCSIEGSDIGIEARGSMIIKSISIDIRRTSINSTRVSFYFIRIPECSIDESEINNSTIGVRLKKMTNCRISRSNIINCQEAIELSSSELLITESHITDCHSGITTVDFDNPDSNLFHSNLSSMRIHFTNVTNPYLIGNLQQFATQYCELTSDTYILIRTNNIENGISNNDTVRAHSITIIGRNIRTMVMDNGGYHSPSLLFDFDHCNISSFNPLYIPELSDLTLQNGSLFMSTLPSKDFNIEFEDSLSSYVQFKTITLEIIKASDGQSAHGSHFLLFDNLTSKHFDQIVGFDGIVEIGITSMVSISLNTTYYHDPYRAQISYSTIDYNITLVLRQFNHSNIFMRLVLDDVRPRISLSSPINEGIYNHSTIIIEGDASDPYGDIQSVSMYYDSGSLQIYDNPWNFTHSFKDGWNLIGIHVLDSNGNSAELERWFYIRTDSVELTFTSPINNTFVNTTMIPIEGQILGSRWLMINSDLIPVEITGYFSKEIVLTNEGTNMISFEYGLPTEHLKGQIIIHRDTTLPKIVFDTVPRYTNSSRVSIVGRVYDENPLDYLMLDNIEYILNSSGYFNITLNLPEGDNVLSFSAEDEAGNSIEYVLNVIVDLSISLVIDDDLPIIIEDDYAIIHITSEENATLTISKDETVVTTIVLPSSTVEIPINIEKVGRHSFSIKVQDASGNRNERSIVIERLPQNEVSIIENNPILMTLIILMTVTVILIILIKGNARRLWNQR